MEKSLRKPKDIAGLSELSYEELTDVLNTWLNPDDASTDEGTETEVSSVVATQQKLKMAVLHLMSYSISK